MANSYNLNDAAVIIMANILGGFLADPNFNGDRTNINDTVNFAYKLTLAAVYKLSGVVGDMSVAVPPASNFAAGWDGTGKVYTPPPTAPPPPTFVEPSVVTFTADNSIAPIRGSTSPD